MTTAKGTPDRTDSPGTGALQHGQPVLSEKQLRRVADYIGREVGIQLETSKHTLVEGRLRRRLRLLGFDDFRDYLDFVLDSADGRNEQLHLIDAITTNKTDFFREPEHFRYLVDTALPELERYRRQHGRPDLHFWSAGCSSGEEPYTLAIVLSETMEHHPGLRFSILATDISKTSLQAAKRAVYSEKRIEPVPLELRRKYFLRSKNRAEELVKMGPELRSRITLGSLNLMATSFGIKQKMDVIFCRNVMIYFNNPIREKLVQRFERQLLPGGYLFIGHSESLNNLKHGLKMVAPMVYRKPVRH